MTPSKQVSNEEQADLFGSVAALLSMALCISGVACQVLLVRLLPMTGLGRILSIPFGILFSVLVAVGFFLIGRRLRSARMVALVFTFALLAVFGQAVWGHPQDFGGTSFTKLWAMVTN